MKGPYIKFQKKSVQREINKYIWADVRAFTWSSFMLLLSYAIKHIRSDLFVSLIEATLIFCEVRKLNKIYSYT
jgi:hypothetical protein